MNERDEAILKHIGKYGLSVRAVIEKSFFGGATCDHVINRLIKERRIRSVAGIPGGLNYYQLSLSEARARSVPEHRARPKKGAALRQALQVLWFCCMSEKNRNRLERAKVSEIFGKGNGNGKPHCAEAEADQSIVYRIYAPGPNSRDDYLLKCLKSETEKGILRPELQNWIAAKAFAFAVLVETLERKERLKRLISMTGPHTVRIHVEVSPGLSTLGAALRDREGAINNADQQH
jgi:hypothetical protein